NFARSNTVAGPRALGGLGLSQMPEKSGLPSAVRGIAEDFEGLCAETMVASATNSDTTRRIITILPFLPFLPVLPFQPSPLLTQSFHHCKHPTAVRERDRVARAVERSVLRAESLHDHLVAGLHGRLADAAPLQHTWRRARESPVRDGPIGIFHVHIEPDVRIG